MQKYKSHKTVEAFKIRRVWNVSAMRQLNGARGEFVQVTVEYMLKHKPEPGGYYVRYENGYESFSPAEAFESGYTAVQSGPPKVSSGAPGFEPQVSIEQEIQDKNLTAPRVTPEHIDSMIVASEYYVFPKTQLTICCLTLRNGFTVTGESACASPENFDRMLGRKIAYTKARDKIWMLEGYLLKQRLFDGPPIDHEIDAIKYAFEAKTLHNSDISGARKNVRDIQVVGNGDSFQLLCKASSEAEGWMKSTKAYYIPQVGCIVQVTTQQRNPDGSYSLAEALTFVPHVIPTGDTNGMGGRKLIQI